ncbi:hypothetical protein [Enterobacter mori]|uniref:hypothetical protein n=1 Tax=Enterobacter mori TaxID=539813 RepID=UPI001B8BA39F|nr:hypothetical protein [Enterobacter mori]MBS3046414.1 hypothetical protein [Enterobacter mori]
MVNRIFKPTVIWGFVCFLLLYRTFPTDIVSWWDVLTQWNVPVWEQVVMWSARILPALIPMGCFILLNNKQKYGVKYVISIPFFAWLFGRFILVVVLWLITFKMTNEPAYSGGLQNIVLRQIETMYLNSHTLVSALIIITCSYAFWRERRY